MNPTQDQLNARLNPTPYDVSLPTEGLFRNVGNFTSSVIRKNADGTYSTVDLGDLGKQSIIDANPAKDWAGNYTALQGSNYGSQAAQGASLLQSKYGFDVNSLPQFNVADIKNIQYSPSGALEDFLRVPVAGSSSETRNGTANAVVTPPNPATPTTAYTGVSIVDYLNSLGQPSDYPTRAKLAEANGIAGYTGSPTQNTQLLNLLRLKNGLGSAGASNSQVGNITGAYASGNTGIPTNLFSMLGISGGSANPNILSGGLSSSGGIPSPYTGITSGGTDINSIIAGLNSYLTTPTDTKIDTATQRLSDLEKSLGGQAGDLKTEMTNQGVFANEDKIKSLNLEAAQLQAELQNIDVGTMKGNENIRNQAIPTDLIVGQQNEYQRSQDIAKFAKSSALASTTALIQAYQNNVDLGLKLAQQSVDLKYAPIKAEIDQQKDLLANYKDKASKDNAKNVKILDTLLDFRKEQIAVQQKNDTAVQTLTVQAAAAGAPLSVINAMKASNDPTTAARLGASYLVAKGEKTVAPVSNRTDVQEGDYVSGRGILLPDGTYKAVKFTPTQEQAISQANLAGEDSINYFLNTPPDFQNEFQRVVASAGTQQRFSLAQVKAAYLAWDKAKANKNALNF